jgi:hypothetical protein
VTFFPGAFFDETFFAEAFFAGAFLDAVFTEAFFAAAFLAGAFFDGAFFAAAFFDGTFLAAVLAEVFFAAAFLAEAFLAGAFLDAAFFADAFFAGLAVAIEYSSTRGYRSIDEPVRLKAHCARCGRHELFIGANDLAMPCRGLRFTLMNAVSGPLIRGLGVASSRPIRRPKKTPSTMPAFVSEDDNCVAANGRRDS